MRRIPPVAVFALAALIGPPAYAHDVKDPVCRMIVESDTTRFKHKLGSKTFYFCSKQCETSFARTPEKYEKLAAELETAAGRDYTVEFQTTPRRPIAGQPVTMAFTIRYADSKELVREFEVLHEKWLHLLMVTQDLAWFEHQHPVRGEDGVFRLTWRFPRPGRYRFYADFTPSDGDNQVKPIELTVGGGEARISPLRPDTKRVKQVGNYRVEWQVRPEPMRMEKAAVLTYIIRDRQGRPIRNMQPFIGAPGHLIAISQDGEQVVHTHALNATASSSMVKETSMPGNGHLVITPEMATEKGPAFSFKLTVPTSGLYKTWAQFMHDNRVVTVPFTFHVADLWESAASVPAKTGRQSGVQRATIVIDGEYHPASLSVKAGRPVQLTFVRKEEAGCGDVVQIPSLKLKRTLKPGQKTVVTFTPNKAGTIAFTCGMNMYRGQIVIH